MTATQNAEIARKIVIIMNHSVEFMANKAGVSRDAIIETIANDPNGATARRFRELLMLGASAT